MHFCVKRTESIYAIAATQLSWDYFLIYLPSDEETFLFFINHFFWLLRKDSRLFNVFFFHFHFISMNFFHVAECRYLITVRSFQIFPDPEPCGSIPGFYSLVILRIKILQYIYIYILFIINSYCIHNYSLPEKNVKLCINF